MIKFNNDKHQIEEYIRKRRSPLNVLANIGSLFSTFFSIFSFIFKFYSEKNNNYTIIKNYYQVQEYLEIQVQISIYQNPRQLNSKIIQIEIKNIKILIKNLLTLVNLYHLNQKIMKL